MTSTRRLEAVVVAATLALAAVAWVITLQRMRGMDMGVETGLGSLPFFIAIWVPMMGAMLPGAGPAVSHFVRDSGKVLAGPVFAGSYLAVWATVGLAVYLLYRPHGTLVAGVLTVAAAAYELTPLKRYCRWRCPESVRSGFEFGYCCLGSSIGLMAMLVALGVMSVTWMSLAAALVLVQKLLPPRASIDVPVALAIAGLGIVILVAPGLVPGLVPSM